MHKVSHNFGFIPPTMVDIILQLVPVAQELPLPNSRWRSQRGSCRIAKFAGKDIYFVVVTSNLYFGSNLVLIVILGFVVDVFKRESDQLLVEAPNKSELLLTISKRLSITQDRYLQSTHWMSNLL